MSQQAGPPASNGPGRAFAVGPIAVAWVVTLGVDLFFNAGLFSRLFDQGREPGLLLDEDLFRRIPVAYLALAAAVIGLAWLLDRTHTIGVWRGVAFGAIVGAVLAATGIVMLWTALDITGVFVSAGATVQISQMAAAGATLSAYRSGLPRRRVTTVALSVALGAAVAGIVVQNLLGP